MAALRLAQAKINDIHPGWYSSPKSGTEMLAVMLGISANDVVQDFRQAVQRLVTESLAFRQHHQKQSYLKHLDHLDQQDAEVRAQNSVVDDDDLGGIAGFRKEGGGYGHGFSWACRRHGGFEEFLQWYETDEWDSDAWWGLSSYDGCEDLRLRKWLDDPSHAKLDIGNELDTQNQDIESLGFQG